MDKLWLFMIVPFCSIVIIAGASAALTVSYGAAQLNRSMLPVGFDYWIAFEKLP